MNSFKIAERIILQRGCLYVVFKRDYYCLVPSIQQLGEEIEACKQKKRNSATLTVYVFVCNINQKQSNKNKENGGKNEMGLQQRSKGNAWSDFRDAWSDFI